MWPRGAPAAGAHPRDRPERGSPRAALLWQLLPSVLAAASLRACNAVIAAFPAVGHGGGPENEAGSLNIEPNYANERTRDSCRGRV